MNTTNSKQEQIKKINLDSNLSNQEKNKKIQLVMSENYLKSVQIKSNESKICTHYEKKCYKFKFECCEIYDPCKRCHAERNCTDKINSKSKVIFVTCSECEYEQPPTNKCQLCKIQFSNSYCAVCQIWTQKDITHCVKCEICRIGTTETLFHCDNCGICFNTHQQEDKIIKHQCIKKKNSNYKDAICVVCLESTFDSQSGSVILPCEHYIHSNCYTKYTQENNYKCPHCKKSICDMKMQWDYIRSQINLHPLTNQIYPIETNDIIDTLYGKFIIREIKFSDNNQLLYSGEFINWKCTNSGKNTLGILNSDIVKKKIYKNIYCNDCRKNSNSLFHFYGIECGYCGSFNTQE